MKIQIYLYEPSKMESFYKKAIAEYDKRLGRYCKIELLTIRKEKEWKRRIEEAQEGYYLLPGSSLSSEELSEQIACWEKDRRKDVTFYVSDSCDEGLPNEALIPFSVSDFQINGAMTAMILYEQIYRAYRIMNNHPYHK